jgi:hypothetical protein
MDPAERRSPLPLLLATAALALAALALGGCSKPLLAPTDERTPFDRYDAVRNQFASQYIEDEFGARKPNLRARLGPKQ